MNSLVCLGKILEYLDKWFVIDEILPFLQQIPSREPAVLMGILGNWFCYIGCMNNLIKYPAMDICTPRLIAALIANPNEVGSTANRWESNNDTENSTHEIHDCEKCFIVVNC